MCHTQMSNFEQKKMGFHNLYDIVCVCACVHTHLHLEDE